MPLDLSKPTGADNYSTQFIPNIQNNQNAAAFWNESTYTTSYAGLLTGVKRLEGGLIQEWNGTTWAKKPMGYAELAGDTFTGKLVTVASSSARAGLNLPPGAAPTTIVNGDLWTTSQGIFVGLQGAAFRLLDTSGIGASGTWSISISGNAATATTAGTCSGNAATASTAGTCSGNAATATKLQTARTLSFAGGATGSGTYDGSANTSITLTVDPAQHAHTIAQTSGLQAALDAKAPVYNPAFTGVPSVPIAAPGTNNTQAAATAFVVTAVANGVAPYAPKASPTFTGQAVFASGSGAAPGIAVAYANMGFYAGSATVMGFAVGGAARATLDSAGTFTATSVVASSDMRLKTNFEDFNLSFGDAQRVRMYTYDRIEDRQHAFGVKAQELQQVLPLAVFSDQTGVLAVDYAKTALAVANAAITELIKLKERVAQLEAAAA